MMKTVLSVLLGFVVVGVFAQPQKYSLNPKEALEYVRFGGIVTYDVDQTKCILNLPPSIRNHSFGDVARDVYIEYNQPGQWRLYTASARPVNGSHVNVTGSVVRVTGFELTPIGTREEDGQVVITLSDIQHGGSEKVLAQGTMTCKYSQGGFAIHPQRVGDNELKTELEVIEAFYFGLQMTYNVDLSACTRVGPPRDAAPAALGGKLYADSIEAWTSDFSAYRVGDTPQELFFTSILESPTQRDVFKVMIKEQSPGAVSLVEIRSFAENHGPEPQPTTEVVYTCAMGQQGQFHAYAYTPK